MGHLQMAVGVRFALGGAVELEYRVDADLPHSLRDGSLLVADSDFALVFVTAQFPLDGDMSTLGEVAGEVSQFPEGDASMPFRSEIPTFRRRSSTTFWWRVKTLRCSSRC